MPITPLDIKNKTFSTQLRGFAPKEVSSFLELLARELEEVRRDRGLLAEKVDKLSAQLDTYARTESLLKETLLTAQKTHQQLRDSAEERSRAILAQAEQKAREIVLKAEQDVERLKSGLREMETRKLNLLDQIRGLAHACLAMADSWEKNDKTEDTAQR